jgi:hypothetical protein
MKTFQEELGVEFLVFSLRQRKGDSFLARGRSGITNSDYCISTIVTAGI